MKLRPWTLVLLIPLVALVLLLGWEFTWRAQHRLLKPQAPSPGGALVAEVRSLPPIGKVKDASGVYLRTEHAYLRSLQPRLVFLGECDNVETRWFGRQRLVIECELRAGEPRLLQDIVDGVVIELIVQRRFA